MVFKRSRKGNTRFRRRPAFKKRRRTPSRKRALAPKVKRNTVKIARVAKIVDSTIGTMTIRKRTENSGLSFWGQQEPLYMVGNSFLDCVSSVTDLQYYDPNSPSTLVTANGNTGSYQREFLFESVNSALKLFNNGQTLMDLRVYQCYPKADTSQQPQDTWKNGVIDQLVGTALGSPHKHPLSRPADSQQFKDLWRTENFKHLRLGPGQEYNASVHLGPFSFDTSTSGVHALTYQQALKGMVWMIVLTGEVQVDSTGVAIDNNSTEHLVLTEVRTTVIKYDAGVGLDMIKYVPDPSLSSLFGYESQKPTNFRIRANGDIET